MSEKNGADAPMRVPNQEQVAAANDMLNRINPSLKAAVQTTIRGLLVSYPGVPPYAVLAAVAFETAHFSASALQGDIAMMVGIRNSFKTAFEEGIRKAPLVPPASNWTPPPAGNA